MTPELTPELLGAIFRHAEATFPREACGLLVEIEGQTRFWPCTNISMGQSHFCLDPADYQAAENAGTVQAIVHSHPNQDRVKALESDRVGCEAWELPWVIVGWPSCDVFVLEPNGYCPPFRGRTFDHGTTDCYGLVKDWFRSELHIKLPQFIRPDNWWAGDANLYLRNLESAGFQRLAPDQAIQRGDLILMCIGSKPDSPNHGGIYVGNSRVLHHLYERLSEESVYGGYFRKVTHSVWRHKDA